MGNPYVRLMESAQRLLGLHLAYHDFNGDCQLPEEWETHQQSDCLFHKAHNFGTCVQFCGENTHRKMLERRQSLCQTCPFGHGEVVALVSKHGMPAGVLYAGAWWEREDEPPSSGFIVRPAKQWIADVQEVVDSLAAKMTAMLSKDSPSSHPRGAAVMNFLRLNLHDRVTLRDVARELGLSPSRAGHVIKEIFGETFSGLLIRVRLEHAALRLRSNDTAISDIALGYGFADQSHFCRAFKKQYLMTPLQYRRANQQAP